MNRIFSKVRIGFVFAVCIAALIYVYVSYARLAVREVPEPPQPPATVERGAIYDRNGKILAANTNFYHFVATPRLIPDVRDFAEKVCGALDMTEDEIVRTIEGAASENFVYIARKISQNQHDALSDIIDANNYGNFTRFDRIPGRVYPENALASQLIGYMGDSGEGLSGVEYTEQEMLSPAAPANATGTVFGNNVYLTIDSGLQYKLERITREALDTTQAEAVILIAADSRTGEVLSYVNLPSADLNEYTTATSAEMLDRASVTAYEPGSVFKIFSISSFLDAGAITPDDSFLCDGVYQRRTNLGAVIRISCLEHHGWLNARGALQFSCNDALAQMSEKIDTETFLTYIRSFGFGERTGAELPSETRGSVKSPDDTSWSARTKPTMAIGQEISVSALQMVQAAMALANGGVLIHPAFIKRVSDRNGEVYYEHQAEEGTRVIRGATAQYVLSCMETVAEMGTGTRAALHDISIGVKTGTAQMADPVNGGYSDTDFVSNCMAIFPVENPQIVLYVVVEKARGETYAGRIVAPVVGRAADEIIDHLGITREGAASLSHSGTIFYTEGEPLEMGDTVIDFTGRSKRDLLPLLERDDLNFVIEGEGWVTRQTPPPGTPVTDGMTIELYLE